jgi:hypothetical protein
MKASTNGLPRYSLKETAAPSRVTPEKSAAAVAPSEPPEIEEEPQPAKRTAASATSTAKDPAVMIGPACVFAACFTPPAAGRRLALHPTSSPAPSPAGCGRDHGRDGVLAAQGRAKPPVGLEPPHARYPDDEQRHTDPLL